MAFLRKDRPPATALGEAEIREAEPTATAPLSVRPDKPLTGRPVIRLGVYAWALIGVAALLVVTGYVVAALRIVVIPLVLALFPAAILYAPTGWLKRRLPDALAALIVLIAFMAILSGGVALLAPQVADELDGLVETAQAGAEQVQMFLEDGAFGFQPVSLSALFEQVQSQLPGVEGVATSVLGVATAVVEGVAGFLFGLVVLFFYLKDGPRMAQWGRDLLPERFRRDAEIIGVQSWQTVGGYIRGQLIIAFVDATLIGIALVVLQVPLALPLSVLVFLGGLFPIVGAILSGLIAVLVALATTNLVTALILLAVIVAVQQLEGDLLAPIVLGRAVQLHPLAVLAALAAGGVLLGILGAFLAIPIAASLSRTAGYLRERVPG